MSEVKTLDALGNPYQLINTKNVEVITADKTIDIEDDGKVFLVGTDALTITLPAVGATTAPEGLTLTFVNSGADGNNLITLSPNASDGIFGSIANAAADSVASGVDDKDIVNTKATANKGDRITLMSDGSTGWYILEGVGIWASEA